MDSDWNISTKEINGINLDNYYIQRRSYNSAVFVHKKFLEEPEPAKENIEKAKVKKAKKDKQQKKQDKCQQFTSYHNNLKDKICKTTCHNNSVLDHTIKFAKNIVPLTIPPDENKSNVFYTIKTSKKRTDTKAQQPSFDSVREKEDPKKVIETYRKIKKESISVRESVSHSSNNTLDDLNINQSLCCTFSEISEKKYHKNDKKQRKRPSREQKFAISESFEAVATETIGGDAKIKIHLMNEKDKQFLSETIQEPVITAIRECILQLNNNNTNTEINTVHKIIKYNSQKLDHILEKLTSIEEKIDIQGKKLDNYEKNQTAQENTLNNYEKQIQSHKNKLDSHGLKIDSYEMKLNSHEMKLETHAKKFESYEEKLNYEVKKQSDEPRSNINSNLDTHSKEKKMSARERNAEIESKKIIQPKTHDSNTKSSTLEELGADLIEMDEDFTSEEELHQELLDRRSKSTVVLELTKENAEDKRMEKLGGGEVPHAAKGTSSIGTKLERPNRIPARFCWTDTVRKN